MTTIAQYRRRLRDGLRDCRPRMSFGVSLIGEGGYYLDLFGFLIAIPLMDRWSRVPDDIVESWGFVCIDKSLMFRWGRRCKVVGLPWRKERVRAEVQRQDGSWVDEVPSYAKGEPDGRHQTIYNYTYHLRSGEVQSAVATVHVTRSLYVWRCFKKMPLLWCLFRWDHSIWVEFDREIGERSGSWKGGCVACGYDMLPGESAGQTLRRMERERKFR